jgi:iron complex transport system permease protein
MTSARGPGLVVLLLAMASAGLAVVVLRAPVGHLLQVDTAGYDVERLVLLYATLPRLAMALLCGAVLGVAGTMLQQALNNPLASPTTLGADSGARLALTAATLWAPSMIGWSRDLVALAGSAGATALVFAIARRRGFGAVALVLAGLVFSLYAGALSSILVLLKDRQLTSLFIWGSGSLAQNGWDTALSLSLRLAPIALASLLLLRPTRLLGLGDDAARGLGVPVVAVRVAVVGVALLMSALVTSAVGVIGFVGLVAPTIARLTGARDYAARLAWSLPIGALLLLLTDLLVQAAAGALPDMIPTGAATAVLGSPLLLWLLPRLRGAIPPPPVASRAARAATRRPLLLALAALVAMGLVALTLGRGPAGDWQWLTPAAAREVLDWRLPRLAVAAAAGALLGTAGLILQRLTGNELASPEMLGIGAGALLTLTLAMVVFSDLGALGQGGAATAGGVAVLGAVLLLGRSSGFAPERVLLAGIALNALIDALVGTLAAIGDPRSMLLLGWMSGSTNGADATRALQGLSAAAALLVLALLARRWLELLPLGDEAASALGLRVPAARLMLVLLAAALTAAAMPLIGPLTFMGLIAPHAMLALGVRRAVPAVLGSAVAGALIMMFADWVARVLLFPLQLPTGLVGALIGAPLLMGLLARPAATR